MQFYTFQVKACSWKNLDLRENFHWSVSTRNTLAAENPPPFFLEYHPKKILLDFILSL